MQYRSHADIINHWPPRPGEPGGIRSFASDISEKLRTVKGWKYRESIPANRWLRVIEAAQERDVQGIDLETLARTQKQEAEARP